MILIFRGRKHDSTLARSSGFTLIELMLVIAVVGALLVFGVRNTSSARLWKRQAALRELNETMRFLFHQAVADQTFYQIEFDLERSTYTVGALRPEPGADDRFREIAADAGNISLELNAFVNPSSGETYTVIPPPDFPSLGMPRPLPEGLTLEAIYTPQGWVRRGEEQRVRMRFSPRGFAEFIVLHLQLGGVQEMTLVNNPFTGLTSTYPEWRDYEWTFGNREDGAR
ncbi:prepilin-type N-terminal cleavage/methylation domain-containing protein [bacterium]|nr:prepilin-type N-terminal cleavage/methylation domain-containing protein [bacterium]